MLLALVGSICGMPNSGLAEWQRRDQEGRWGRLPCDISSGEFKAELARIQNNLTHILAFVEKAPPREHDWIEKELAESLDTGNSHRLAAAIRSPWYPSYKIMNIHYKISEQISNTYSRIGMDALRPEKWLPTAYLSVHILQEYGRLYEALGDYYETKNMTDVAGTTFQVSMLEREIIDVIKCTIYMVGKKN